MKQQVRAHAGYEEDFHAWADEQAGLLRGGKFAQADLDNIAEELEGLSRSERRALLSSLRLIVLHLLKLRHQPERATTSRHTTIHRERMKVEDALADMPSLRSHLPALFEKAYRDGRRLAIVETGLAADLFPDAHEFTYDQVSDAGYLPEADGAEDMPIAVQEATPTGSRLLLARLKRSDQT